MCKMTRYVVMQTSKRKTTDNTCCKRQQGHLSWNERKYTCDSYFLGKSNRLRRMNQDVLYSSSQHHDHKFDYISYH